jgi:hypothetical protein
VSFLASVVLIGVLLFRPQEIWPELDVLHLLDVLTGLAALGVIVEFARGEEKDPYTPQLPFLALLFVIIHTSTAITVGTGELNIGTALIPTLFMLVTLYGSRTFIRLRSLLVTLIVIGTCVSAIGIAQGLAESQCIPIELGANGERVRFATELADGRTCETAKTCRPQDEWEFEWACERLGPFDSMSVGRRVKWRGQLEDPNELSVFIGTIIPLVMALLIRRERKVLAAIGAVLAVVGLFCIVLTQSRGGQLVVGAVFGTYFFARFRWKGLLAAAAFAGPVLLFGGREGAEDADASTAERIELLYDGIRLVLAHPIVGVGKGQFADYMSIHLTAHNSYLLAAAELGIPGLFAWSGLYWVTLKIPLSIVRRPPQGLDPEIARIALALVASYLGMAVGIFFLSFCYKQLLFVWFGVAGALYGVIRHDHPDFRVTVGWKDLMGLFAFDVLILTFIFVSARLKMGGG